MLNTLTNLGEGVVLQIQLYRLYPVGEGSPDIPLLGTEWHSDSLLAQRLRIATDSTQTTVEDAERQVLGRQQCPLVNRLLRHSRDLPSA